ncbi:hypothetical protein Tco_0424747 [Tanacetum coccineum]
MDSMHSTLSMYYDYDAHVKGELLVMMKNSQSVNLLIFISNTLIELFNDFGFDCDGIPKRPTMYLNLWSYKVVRHRYSNPMIQPEPEGSTQGYPLDSVEVLRSIITDSKVTPTKHGRMTNPYSSSRFVANCFISGIYKEGRGVKEFQRSFCHSDTERLSQSDEVLKLKNFKKDATLNLFKSTNQEMYEHVGPIVTSLQDGEKKLCLVDDLKVFKITFSHTSQDKGTSSSLKSMITTSIHKLMIEGNDYKLKTNGKA